MPDERSADVNLHHGTRLRVLARTLRNKAEAALKPMTQNPTSKRMREYLSRCFDGHRFHRMADLCCALAQHYEERGEPFKNISGVPTLDVLTTAMSRQSENTDGIREKEEWMPIGPQWAKYKTIIELRKLFDAACTKPSSEQERNARKESQSLEHDIQQLRLSDRPGFFPTPDDAAETMVAMAQLEPGMRVLEPSAGIGHIAEKAAAVVGIGNVFCIEKAIDLHRIIARKGFVEQNIFCCDFTKVKPSSMQPFDVVLMNPPFEQRNDALHVMHAYQFVKDGGLLIAITGPAIYTASDKISFRFQRFFEDAGGHHICDVDFSTAFRRTNVKGRMIAIQK